MTQHTPGPWTFHQIEKRHHGYEWQTFAIRSAQNICLATVGDIDRYESERSPANARLIAKAPEMLVLLKTLTETVDDRALAAARAEARALLKEIEGC